MSNEEITDSIRLSGYPDDLADNEIGEAIKHTLRELRAEYPLILYGSFLTVQDQFIYDLFNPVLDVATQQGVFPGGMRAHELVWSGTNLESTSNIFGLAPWLQNFSILPGGYMQNSFYTPSDWVIWDQNWAALKERFSPMDWEHTESRYGSPIRLFSGPCINSGTHVLIQFSKARTLDDLQNEDPSWFLMMVEAQCCFTLANKFSCAAGVEFQGVKDTGILRAHWETQARRKNEEALRTFEKRKIEGLSSGRRWH